MLPVLLALSLLSLTGDPYPKDYFRSPLGIPLYLAGNFAEMRPGHFHSGLDLKTNNREGYRVYAAAEGYISRIKVSPTGFGHALYVSHPNGFTTVYAHLGRFKSDVAAYVKRVQYERREFAVDLYLDPDTFPVKKGDVIAFSGNTGSSGGPHLHFEVRDTETQEPINPLLFGFEVADSTPPRIYRIRVYARDEDSRAVIHSPGASDQVVRKGHPASVEVVAGGGVYRLAPGTRIEGAGRLGFGIQTNDYMEGSRNRLGAYRIRLEADGTPLFASTMERFRFDQTRYINAHVDYAVRKRLKRWIQRSFILPGNRLPLYESRGGGWLTVAPGDRHVLHYVVEDVFGNRSEARFEVEGVAIPANATTDPPPALTLSPTEPATFAREDVRVIFPAGAFYDTVPFTYRKEPGPAAGLSPEHVLHEPTTPVHRRFQLSIRADDVPPRLRPRVLLGTFDDDGKVTAAGGEYREGWVTGRVREFGPYFILADTLAPEITPVRFRSGRTLRGRDGLYVRIRDDLSGIASYAGYVDGTWVLFEYDPKTNRLFHRFDEHILPGRHTLRLEVVDQKANRGTFETTFVR